MGLPTGSRHQPKLKFHWLSHPKGFFSKEIWPPHLTRPFRERWSALQPLLVALGDWTIVFGMTRPGIEHTTSHSQILSIRFLNGGFGSEMPLAVKSQTSFRFFRRSLSVRSNRWETSHVVFTSAIFDSTARSSLRSVSKFKCASQHYCSSGPARAK